MNIRKRIAALALTGAVVGGGLIATTAATAGTAGAATQGEVVAQSCYGNAWSYSKPSGTPFSPTNTTYLTTANCADINIKTNTDRKVKVCFYAGGGGLNYCQPDYKSTKAGEWKVIASDVKDGTKFRFQFESSAASTGMRAH